MFKINVLILWFICSSGTLIFIFYSFSLVTHIWLYDRNNQDADCNLLIIRRLYCRNVINLACSKVFIRQPKWPKRSREISRPFECWWRRQTGVVLGVIIDSAELSDVADATDVITFRRILKHTWIVPREITLLLTRSHLPDLNITILWIICYLQCDFVNLILHNRSIGLRRVTQ